MLAQPGGVEYLPMLLEFLPILLELLWVGLTCFVAPAVVSVPLVFLNLRVTRWLIVLSGSKTSARLVWRLFAWVALLTTGAMLLRMPLPQSDFKEALLVVVIMGSWLPSVFEGVALRLCEVDPRSGHKGSPYGSRPDPNVAWLSANSADAQRRRDFNTYMGVIWMVVSLNAFVLVSS